MRRDHPIRSLLRRARRAVPWRDQAKRKLRSAFGLEPQRNPLKALAESAGVFDAEWYASSYADVADSRVDPFTHYMTHGWRAKRRPADGIDIESLAAMAPGFRPGRDNPISYLLENLARLEVGQERVSRFASLPRNLEDGICVSGYLCSEIGLGQAARNIVYACDAVRLPVSPRALQLPERDNDGEFASKCNPVVDRKVHIVVADLASIDGFRPEIAPGSRNVLFPFWELGRIPKRWHAGIGEFAEIWAP